MSRLRGAARAVVNKSDSDAVLPCIDLEHVEGFTGRLTVDLDEAIGAAGERVRFEAGDVLTSKLRPYLGKAFLADFDGAASGEFVVLRAHAGVSSRWLQYVALSSPFIDHAVRTSTGVKMPRSSAEELLRFEFWIPDQAHQVKIADFLDRETQRIDLAVIKLRQLLDLASEREFSAITAAIDAAAEGMIRLSLVAKLGTGHTPDRAKPEYWEDCTIPWVTAADLSGRSDPYEPLTQTSQHVSELGVANSAAVVHPAGTVMLCRTASVGLFCRIGAPMATTQAFATWTPEPSIDSEYLMYCLVAMRDEWNRLKFGSTHDTIYFPDIQSIKIPFASLAAQHQAVGEIQVALDQTRELRQRATELMELLLERRQALISAAVTGQLAVEAMV